MAPPPRRPDPPSLPSTTSLRTGPSRPTPADGLRHLHQQNPASSRRRGCRPPRHPPHPPSHRSPRNNRDPATSARRRGRRVRRPRRLARLHLNQLASRNRRRQARHLRRNRPSRGHGHPDSDRLDDRRPRRRNSGLSHLWRGLDHRPPSARGVSFAISAVPSVVPGGSSVETVLLRLAAAEDVPGFGRLPRGLASGRWRRMGKLFCGGTTSSSTETRLRSVSLGG